MTTPHAAPDSPVLVVGAGLAGAACAAALHAAGVPVRVLDRGRRPGGRMSGKALGGREADLGASYFTVGDDDFAAVVEGWRARGLARPWTDTFTVLAPDQDPVDKDGPLRWSGTRGLRALVDAVLEPFAGALERRTVDAVTAPDGRLLVDGEPARAVVLAMPDPQATRLLGPGLDDVCDVLTRTWEPTLAVAARWERRSWDGRSPNGTFHGAFVEDPAISWVADDGRRRGDDAPVVVAHSTPDLARAHLEDPAGAEPVLREALLRLLGAPEPEETLVHRWTFAKPTGERAAAYHLDRVGDGLVGVCGDGWGETSKVGTAWRSGHDLGRALAAELAAERD